MSAHFYCGKNIKGTDKLRIGWIANRWERPSSCSGLKQADDDDEAIFKVPVFFISTETSVTVPNHAMETGKTPWNIFYENFL